MSVGFGVRWFGAQIPALTLSITRSNTLQWGYFPHGVVVKIKWSIAFTM